MTPCPVNTFGAKAEKGCRRLCTTTPWHGLQYLLIKLSLGVFFREQRPRIPAMAFSRRLTCAEVSSQSLEDVEADGGVWDE